MTELSFLIELLLNHELPKETKKLIADRIKEVEQGLVTKPVEMRREGLISEQAGLITYSGKMVPVQAPSTLALMAKHGDIPTAPLAPPPEPPPVAVIAQTPATAAAMLSRADIMAGKVDKYGKPRK